MQLDAGSCLLRPWRPGDREQLAEIANDRRISRNMTDMFPHPYTPADADEWIGRCAAEEPPLNFAIVVGHVVVGGIGAHRLEGEQQGTINVGYWLAPSLWGQGIATDALRHFVDYLFDTFPARRLYATVFGWNPASARVLEKGGFTLEGRLREAIVKDDDVTDLQFYGLLRRELKAES